ncbi:MAG: acylneuraminate cytidylyltransferase [Opitutaceae bacterium]|nr:acylneuraminate cytidylyltransferase [Opitutaceae bacterium]
MVYSAEILALIPARSGSKSIPHKNVQPFAGKPLLAHSIEQARACPAITRVIVSTDSEAYAEIARRFGAEVPFLRPAGISGDASTDLEVFQHALRWLVEKEGRAPELCVHLRPTHPNRRVADITAAIDRLHAHPEWDSVRSVVPAPEPPFKMWFRSATGELTPVVTTDIPEAHSRPRQTLPAAFLQNASIDIIRSRTILEKNSIAGATIGSILLEEFHDIDTPGQLAAAEADFAWREGVPTGKTFCCDIDGVLATLVPNHDYTLAGPMVENIGRLNRLHAAGNRIVLFTARGSMTGIDWAELTRRQMRDWGVAHHELRLGKPAADYYIDDRMLSLAALAGLDRVSDSPPIRP